MIDVLYVKVGEAPMMKRIEPELAEFQKLVDGDEPTSVPPEQVEGLREMFRRPIDPAVAEGLRRAYSMLFFSAEA